MGLFGPQRRQHVATKHIVCHGCGKEYKRRPGADLYCSPKCEKEYGNLQTSIRERLTAEGFVQDAQYTDSYVKSGIAVNVRFVAKHGVEEALSRHASAILHYGGAGIVGAAPSGESTDRDTSEPTRHGA